MLSDIVPCQTFVVFKSRSTINIVIQMSFSVDGVLSKSPCFRGMFHCHCNFHLFKFFVVHSLTSFCLSGFLFRVSFYFPLFVGFIFIPVAEENIRGWYSQNNVNKSSFQMIMLTTHVVMLL